MNKIQVDYTTTEKKLLAIAYVVDKFKSYLMGTQVIVCADHSALKYLLQKKEDKPRLIRWVLILQEFGREIRHKKGFENVVAKHLSKLPNEKNEANSLPIQKSFLDE